MSTSEVKFLHSDMAGHPVLSGAAGGLLAVLNACLVDGWGSATITSLVIASGVATVTKTGHPFEADMVTEIAGASTSGGSVNGQKKILSASSSTYTFDATGVPDQTATGTITHKVAALGWTKPYADAGNVGVYRNDTVGGTGFYLRVDDSGTGNARVVGYLAMTDLNTGTGAFMPVTGGGYWPKSSTTDSTERGWTIIGDNKSFVIRSLSVASAGSIIQYFGDIKSRKAVDPYRCVVHAPITAINGSSSPAASDLAAYGSGYSACTAIARGVSGLGSGVTTGRAPWQPTYLSALLYYSGVLPAFYFPNPADNTLMVSLINLTENGGLRGTFRGAYSNLQSLNSAFANHAAVTGVDLLPGRRLRALAVSTGALFMDVTGPWEY